MIVGFDFTKPVRESIKEVEETLLIAFGLVVIIIFLFLRDWRSTIIPVLAIPVSILSAFFIMYIFSFSINVLTLLGLVLAIGLVVDDAIVVVEESGAKQLKEIYGDRVVTIFINRSENVITSILERNTSFEEKEQRIKQLFIENDIINKLR